MARVATNGDGSSSGSRTRLGSWWLSRRSVLDPGHALVKRQGHRRERGQRLASDGAEHTPERAVNGFWCRDVMVVDVAEANQLKQPGHHAVHHRIADNQGSAFGQRSRPV